MGRLLRKYENGEVYFLTNRLAEGLPFVPNSYINSVLKGILAKASCRYLSIKINAWVFMPNHYHGVVTIDGDPAEMSGFLGYIDGETAKIVCRMLGKRNVKIWAHRPHAAPMLTPETVIDKLAYLYLNAAKANLCSRAGDWFGVSTWAQFMGAEEEVCKWIRPSKVKYLPKGAFTKKQLTSLMQGLEELKSSSWKLKVSPCYWAKCFPETRNLTPEQQRNEVLSIIAKEEHQYSLDRAKNETQVANRQTLELQNPHKYYKPKKFGVRAICISRCEEARKLFIAQYLSFLEACREAWDSWKNGKLHIKYPPGAFIPPQLPLANVVPGMGYG